MKRLMGNKRVFSAGTVEKIGNLMSNYESAVNQASLAVSDFIETYISMVA